MRGEGDVEGAGIQTFAPCVPDEYDVVLGHNCCATEHGSGCSDPAIEACVCVFDRFCCETTWDETCVDEVAGLGCGTCTPASADCNANGTPDECEPDCNANGVPDDCDVVVGHDCCATGHGSGCNDPAIETCVCDQDRFCCETGWDQTCVAEVTALGCGSCAPYSSDCDTNGVPDECDPDCNGNDIPDACDVAAGTSPDCNTNGVPDECDVAVLDCNANGVPDDCEPDFDGDGLTDDCDPDIDNDGVPNEADVCDYTPTSLPPELIEPDGSVRGDLDGDCDVDLADYAIMQARFTGPNP